MIITYKELKDFIFIPHYEIKVEYLNYYNNVITTQTITLEQATKDGLEKFLIEFEEWKESSHNVALDILCVDGTEVHLAKPFDYLKTAPELARARIEYILYYEDYNTVYKVEYRESY